MKKDRFDTLLENVRTMARVVRGETTLEAAGLKVSAPEGQPAAPSPAAIRERLGLTQAEFSSMLGVSLRTLQGWEIGRRHPTGPARSLLRIAAQRPDAVIETLGKAS